MKRQKKKYEKPLKPWDRERRDEEKKLLETYGLRRKREIWRVESILRKYRRLARNLAAKQDKDKEKILLDKLFKMGIIKKDANLDDILALNIEKFLDRRLQTIVFKKGLTSTIRQARQLIVHGHISLDGRRVRWPSMILNLGEEDKISFYEKSKIKGVKVEKS